MLTIGQLVDRVASIANKAIAKNYVPGPVGVRGRTSDNRLIRDKLGWTRTTTLSAGLVRTYGWIEFGNFESQGPTRYGPLG